MRKRPKPIAKTFSNRALGLNSAHTHATVRMCNGMWPTVWGVDMPCALPTDYGCDRIAT